MKFKHLKIQLIEIKKHLVTVLVDSLKSIETILTLLRFIIISISLAKPVDKS